MQKIMVAALGVVLLGGLPFAASRIEVSSMALTSKP